MTSNSAQSWCTLSIAQLLLMILLQCSFGSDFQKIEAQLRSDGVIVNLGRAKETGILTFHGDYVTDQQVCRVIGIVPEVYDIGFSDSKITGESLRCIGQLRRLRKLGSCEY